MLFGPCHARNLNFVACKQQSRRQVCTSVQSDLLLCYSLFGRYNNYSCYMRNFNILAGLWSCAGCFWTLPGRDSPDRFSYVESNFILLSFIMLICKGLLMSFPISSLCKYYSIFLVQDKLLLCNIILVYLIMLHNKISLGITICYNLGSFVMPSSDPWDVFFYQSLTLMIASNNVPPREKTCLQGFDQLKFKPVC